MAIALFDGQKVRCTPVRQVNGTTDWIMSSCQHTARLVHGTHFRVSAGEIVEMDAITSLVDASPEFAAAVRRELQNGHADVEAAMAKERETLPTPAQVIRDNQPIAHDAPNKVET